jgi:2-polyprenyl-3-methyl-5-hydroxy-6-metoxy-1,4-benzoquinol methylase
VRNMLIEAGYQLNSITNVWSRPEYVGIIYSDGDDVEERIGEIIATSEDVSVLSQELRGFCVDWPSRYHLSSARSNILRPLKDLIQGAKILEIGAGCGAITRYLGESGGDVLALEGTPRRAAIARSRTRGLKNVTVVSEQFSAFQTSEKFDVITLIGVLEYANLFTQGENPHASMLEQVKGLLKPEGTLIIAIENQLGLKYFSGVPEDHISKAMYGIEGRYQKNEAQTFGKKALTDLLNLSGFSKSKFYAPFPDYKLPTSIITEKGCGAEAFDAAAFACLSVRRDYQLPSELTFSLELAWNEVFKNGLGLEMANSFLVVATPEASLDVLNDAALAYHYSTERRPQFCKETQFSLAADGKVAVKKVLLHEMSDPHVSKSGQGIQWMQPKSEDYISGYVLATDFLKTITSHGWEVGQLVEHLHKYLGAIADMAGFSENHFLDAASSIPGKYLDALPSNIVIDKNGEAHFIDDEWHAKEAVDIKYLLFRVLTSLNGLVSQYGMPIDPAIRTTRHLVDKVFSEFGLDSTDHDIQCFLKREEELHNFSTGRDNTKFNISLLNQELPGLGNGTSAHWLKERLLLTEQVKERAEKLALARMFELDQLNQRLSETEMAKENAERLAFGRLSELDTVNQELSAMRAAKDFAEKLAFERLNEISVLNTLIADLRAGQPRR